MKLTNNLKGTSLRIEVSAEEFAKQSCKYVLQFITRQSGACRMSQFPRHWNQDILHGALEILCRRKEIKKMGMTYSLVIPASMQNKKSVGKPIDNFMENAKRNRN